MTADRSREATGVNEVSSVEPIKSLPARINMNLYRVITFFRRRLCGDAVRKPAVRVYLLADIFQHCFAHHTREVVLRCDINQANLNACLGWQYDPLGKLDRTRNKLG
jgi:hypothetical protein